MPKTQNKPIKVFFNFSRGRSELRKISTGSYEELFKKSFQGKKYKLISKSQTFWTTMYVRRHLKLLLY